MSKFKIGDKVTRKKGAGPWNDLKEGDVGIVTGFNSNNEPQVDYDISAHMESMLELVKEEKQMKINYIILTNSVVVNYDGKTTSIKKDDGRYKDVVQAIKENRLSDIPDLVDVKNYFNSNGFEIKNGLLHIDNEPLPESISKRVLEFREQGLPFEPLLKFWNNLKDNPSFNSRQMLFKFLEHNGHPLTDDGCFIAYRGVTEDFKDLHTRKFDNSVGKVCEVPRQSVDDNPNNTCSHGLHVACFDYAKGFGPQLIEVKVNPKDVVAVPTDYNGTKMRVCKFEVVAVGEKPRTESLYDQDEIENNECSICYQSSCYGDCDMDNDTDEFEDIF